MKIKKIVLLLLLSCSFSLSAFTLESLQQKLTEQTLLRGEFNQAKKLQIFNAPLLSSGHFLLSHQQGLIWQQNSPFSVSLVLAKDKLYQQFAGKNSEVIEAKDNPMVFYFSHLFLSLFKGDLAALQEQFVLSLTGDDTQWQLLLTPKSAPLNKVFESIEIKGDEQIQGLALLELNGDSSRIEFSNISNTPAQLTENEINAFDF